MKTSKKLMRQKPIDEIVLPIACCLIRAWMSPRLTDVAPMQRFLSLTDDGILCEQTKAALLNVLASIFLVEMEAALQSIYAPIYAHIHAHIHFGYVHTNIRCKYVAKSSGLNWKNILQFAKDGGWRLSDISGSIVYKSSPLWDSVGHPEASDWMEQSLVQEVMAL